MIKMTQPILLLVAVLAVTTTVVNVNADDTIFSQLFPTACVNPLLNSAGFCTLNAGCTEKCFGSVAAAELGVPSGFYFPVDAVECNEFEDPICPTTSCCPQCRNELQALYKCLILKSTQPSYEYLHYLAKTCPLDCVGYENDEVEEEEVGVESEEEAPIVSVPDFNPAPMEEVEQLYDDDAFNLTGLTTTNSTSITDIVDPMDPVDTSNSTTSTTTATTTADVDVDVDVPDEDADANENTTSSNATIITTTSSNNTATTTTITSSDTIATITITSSNNTATITATAEDVDDDVDAPSDNTTSNSITTEEDDVDVDVEINSTTEDKVVNAADAADVNTVEVGDGNNAAGTPSNSKDRLFPSNLERLFLSP